MQVLCELDVQHEGTGDHTAALLHLSCEETHDEIGGTRAFGSAVVTEGSAEEAAVLAYARELVSAYHGRRQGVDDRVSAAAEHWELPRMLSVDRNVMRVAVVEMLLGETPMKVAIDEAIEIAREYGSEDSAKFVNGVLDLIYQRLARSEAGGSE
jgi:N utilization substance protein B